MALKPCKECGTPVSSGAKACPKCGKEWPTGKPMSMGMIGCLGIIGLGVVSALLGRGGSSEAPETPAQVEAGKERMRNVTARTLCKMAVEERLKAPKTADFDDVTALPIKGDTLRYLVRGRVTAVNSFNAPIANTIRCEVLPDENRVPDVRITPR
jgi:hypothetical protein